MGPSQANHLSLSLEESQQSQTTAALNMVQHHNKCQNDENGEHDI